MPPCNFPREPPDGLTLMGIVLEGVTRMVGAQTHLYPMDLTFEAGSLTVLLGPVRAGKTTLMRVLAGLDRPTSGRVVEDGQDVTRMDVRRRSVAMVYQQFINYPNFTVYRNIASPLERAGGMDRKQIDTRVRDVAGRLGLSGLLDRLPAELSGGQQQRTALARSLVKNSKLLLLDEPLVNLDYKLREDLRAEMKALFKSGDRTVVYATTEPHEALLLGGRTCILREGRVVQVGDTLQVYRAPANLDAAHLISDPPMNLLPGTVTGSTLQIDHGPALPAPDHLPAGRYTFGLHASEISLDHGGAVIPVVLELAEINGSETLLHGACGALSLLLQLGGVHHLELGATLEFRFDPARLYAFDSRGQLVAAPDFAQHPVREASHGAHHAL
jgi:glycerol transport system ATP-binding protein